MLNLNRKYLGLVILALSLASCATTTSQKAVMDEQVKAQPEANTPEQIAKRAADAFANAPGLTADQKQKLHVIYSKTYAEAMMIRTEIGQSKSLLFQMISTKDYKSKEVNQLKDQIVALDEKRLAVMFKALENVQAVVGLGKNNEEIYRHLREFEFPRRNYSAE